MRRMSGRSPPFAVVGVIVVFLFISYNLWSASSRNDDLTIEIEKLQIEIKLCATKQKNYDRSGFLFQGQINDLQSKLEESRKYTENEKSVMKKTDNELSNLKNQQMILHKIEEELKQDVERKDANILKLEKKLELAVNMKDEADMVIAEKDKLINKLQQQLEQVKRDLHLAYAQENDHLKMNIQSNDVTKEPDLGKGSLKPTALKSVHTIFKSMYGSVNHPGLEMLPKQPPDVARDKPRFSVADVTSKTVKVPNNQVPDPHIEHGDIQQLNNVQNVIHNPETLKEETDIINGLQQQVLQKPLMLPEANNVHDQISAVLNVPPKALKQDNLIVNIPFPSQNLAENPDTAIDEIDKNWEDPADDQDEEGKEIKHDLEALPGGGDDGKRNFEEFNNNIDYEEGNERNGLPKNVIKKGENPEPRGIGIRGFPHSKDVPVGEDFVNFEGVPDPNEAKPNDHLFERKFSNKIRNMGKL